MNIPKLRFPEFEGEWERNKLGEISNKVGSGSTPRGGDKVYQNTGIVFIRSQNVKDDRLVLDDVVYISESIHSKMGGSVVKANDILLNITGASLGRSCVVQNSFIEGNVNQHVCIIRLDNNNYPYFLQPLLSSSKGQKLMFQAQTGSGREGLNFQSIRRFRLSIPPLPEQQKIAQFLRATDKKLHALKKKKSLLEQYKKGIMQKIFSQETIFKDDNGKEFPDWEERKFYEILTEHKRRSSGNEEVFSVSVHKGLINQIEHLGRSFAAANTSNYNLVRPHDIVYTKSPTGDYPYGIIKQSFINKNVIVSPLYGVFTPETAELGYLLNVYFETVSNVHNYLHSIIQKGAKNTINITNSTFLSKSMKLPIDKYEQKKIGEFLKSIDKKIKKTETKITQTEQWKKGLLQQMFV